MSGATFTAWYTLAVFGIMIIVILWAYRPKNKHKYDDIAKSIVDEDQSTSDSKDANKVADERESKHNE